MNGSAIIGGASQAPQAKDGRRHRSDVSRERIVGAMLDLVVEGDISPSAEAVAARAGVGLRTVFRHFENMEGLYQQINALIAAEIAPIAARPFTSADWKARIGEIVDRRIAIFERIMPLKIAGDVHRHRSPFLAAQAAQTARDLREAIDAVIPAALREDGELAESLDLILSFESWRRLRKDQGLSRARARSVLARLIETLIAAL